MEPPYTIADFHHVLRKQLASAASAALAEAKMRPSEFDSILYAARSLCRDELERDGRLALHGLEQRDDTLVPAEEAYLSVAAGDPEGDGEWLSLTYWLSDLALADRDPERVRAVVTAIEASLSKVRAWLDEQDAAPRPRAKRAPKVKPSVESPDS
jgi:hypothetical protein